MIGIESAITDSDILAVIVNGRIGRYDLRHSTDTQQ